MKFEPTSTSTKDNLAEELLLTNLKEDQENKKWQTDSSA